MKKNMIFIASRAHSGSTMLSLLLSGHPRLVALGEVFNLFDIDAGYIFQQDKNKCSCGESMANCPFWGPTTSQLRANPKQSPKDMYDLVLNNFFRYFGEDYIPVDSSKTDGALKVLANVNLDLRVLFLIRDVRPWVVSMRKARSRRSDLDFKDLVKKYGIRAPYEYVLRSSYKYFWHWYLLNRRTKKYLLQEEIPTLKIGYEELCLYPELIIQTMGGFLNLELDPEMMLLGSSQNHIIMGNRMRHQVEKRKRIYYDNRWFYMNDWILPSIIFPYIMNYNAREVYEHIRKQDWLKK